MPILTNSTQPKYGRKYLHPHTRGLTICIMKSLVLMSVLLASGAVASAAAAQDVNVEQSGKRFVFSIPLAQPEPPHPTGLADVVRAKFPLSVEFSEMGEAWRELEYRGQSYFTRGEPTWVNDAEMLVAYKYDAELNQGEPKVKSERELIGRLTGAGRSFEPGDRFALTLLPLREVASYVSNGQTNLRSFSAGRFRVPFDPPLQSSAFRQNLTVLYLSQIGAAVAAYGSKYLSVTPPLETAFAARQALLPFVESERVFFVPNSDVPFKTNPILGNRKREHLRKRRSMVMFYQAEPAEDGLRAVLLFGGQVRRVDQKAWARLSRASLLS